MADYISAYCEKIQKLPRYYKKHGDFLWKHLVIKNFTFIELTYYDWCKIMKTILVIDSCKSDIRSIISCKCDVNFFRVILLFSIAIGIILKDKSVLSQKEKLSSIRYLIINTIWCKPAGRFVDARL